MSDTDSHKPLKSSNSKKFSDSQKIQYVREWEQSGGTKLDYARKVGVHVVTFYSWVRKFGQRTAAASPLFIPASIVDESSVDKQLNIQLPGGAFVTLGPSPDLDTLAQLLIKLEEAKC